MLNVKLRNFWHHTWLYFPFALASISILSTHHGLFDIFLAERIASLFAILFLAALAITSRLRLNLSNADAKDALSFLFLTTWVLAQTRTLQLAPSFFFIFLTAFHFINSALYRKGNIEIHKNNFLPWIFHLTTAGLFIPATMGLDFVHSLDTRLSGTFPSPTTFSSWIIVFFIITFCATSKYKPSQLSNRISIAVAAGVTIYFVLLSQTRTNFAATVVILLLLLAPKLYNTPRKRRLILIVYFFIVFLAYYIYQALTEGATSNPFADRYESGEDHSYGLRIALFYSIIESISSSGVSGLLLGLGSESSRNLIIEIWGADLLPHNDVIRTIHDYGLPFALAYFTLIINIASKTKESTLIGIIYITCLLHNMILSHYIIALIVLFSKTPAARTPWHQFHVRAPRITRVFQ